MIRINRDSNEKNVDKEKNHPFSKWMSWLFWMTSVLLLIYTFFRAEISYQGSADARHFYFKYYLISLTGVLFWSWVLRLRKEIRTNIVMVLTSIVIGLYMVEGTLTFFKLNRQPIDQQTIDRAAAAAKLGVEFDKRTKLEVVEALIAEGMDAVPTFHSAELGRPIEATKEDTHSLFPLGGVSNKTTVYTNESGKYLVYKSDRHGFNNPDSQWNAQPLEWLLTGDSFTHGLAVQPGQEIAGQLRSITGDSAISLGIGGNGPLVEYGVLVEYGMTLAPAKVLWIYFEGNDLIDLQREKSNPLLMKYLQTGFSQNLINRQKEIDSRLREYIVSAKAKEAVKPNKTAWLRLAAIRNLIDFDNSHDIDDPLFVKILTKAKARVEGWGGKLYFVYLPMYERYNDKSETFSHDRYKKKAEIIDLVKGLNIPVIDIHKEVFAAHTDPLALFPFRLPGHYNAKGYAEVSKAIVREIIGSESK